MTAVARLRPVQSRPTVTDLVLDALKSAIIKKTLSPGTRVSEASLAAELKVSKTPVREALLRLRDIGLVEMHDDGLRVIQASQEKIRSCYDFRAGVERMSAHWAAQRATVQEREVILAAARASLVAGEVGDPNDFRRSDRLFHLNVARAAHNPLLEAVVENALLLCAVLRARDAPQKSDSISCGAQHVNVAELIQRSDADGAAEQMSAHIASVQAAVMANLDTQSIAIADMADHQRGDGAATPLGLVILGQSTRD